jgi:uncharacterized protein YegJ (DUF2314 family)
MKRKFRRISLIALVIAPVIAGSTAKLRAANVVSKELTQGGSEPGFFQVPHDHAAMHNAVIEARKTIREFIKALKHPAPGQEDFEVKKAFTQGNQVEHIWISDVQIIGHHLLQGRVDNQPRKITGVKLGQVVTVNPKEISDWLYVDNGKLVGGYTVRVHYGELSPKEKAEFDREANFKIGTE